MIDVGRLYGGQSYADPTAYAAIVPAITGGVTETMYCPWCGDMWVQVDATGLSTVNSLSVVVEGSVDNSGWDNIDANDVPTVITSNGTTLFSFPGSVPPYVRITGLENAPAVVTAQVFFGRVS